ncbi:molybdenum-dependent transcriptional regulator [Salmonella enterica subsp. enterica serovar Infantis]|nr:molybdenum-dependent transcriptional regulator [Salmonella enterica subsp. enterica serovar Infantis]
MTARVIALDLDGTLLTPHKTLLPSSLDALSRAKEAGFQLIIVTGRHHVAIHPFYQALALETPAICCNGTYLYDYQAKTVLDADPMPVDKALQLIDLLDEHQIHGLMYVDDAMLYEHPTGHVVRTSRWAQTLPPEQRPTFAQVSSLAQAARDVNAVWKFALSGSISQGAKDAGISYKSAWDAINDMNQLSEHMLVERATGGKGGGGAVLTRYGQRLIQLYDLLGQIQQKAFDVLSDDDALPLDSLLAAISRFSLQTSARNQWFGTITARDRDQVQQHVDVLLADGKTRLKVALTAQSGERLGLEEGKEVLILLKAPWVGITRDAAVARAADNQLSGTISHIERGAEQCEVLMALPDGQTLCATIPTSDAATLKEGDDVIAWFNADRVIIATLC